ncbi:MAG: hypothetical protein ABSC30_07820 [Acidimicrobiales bacterium]
MSRYPRLVLPRRWTGGVAALGLGYAIVASLTRPFTWGADVVTSVPLVVAAVVTMWSSATTRGVEARHREATGARDHGAGGTRRWVVWLGPMLAITGWELYCFFSLPRVTHPTLSSLLDILDSTRAGKTVAFALWLVLGWFLVVS